MCPWLSHPRVELIYRDQLRGSYGFVCTISWSNEASDRLLPCVAPDRGLNVWAPGKPSRSNWTGSSADPA